jgi:cell wall-associated NlpC family hydrolase
MRRVRLAAGPGVVDTRRVVTRTLAITLLTVATGACASSGVAPRPFPAPGPDGSAWVAPDVDRLPADVVRAALALQGRPYLNGGSSPDGFDCSGFVWYVFGERGLALPRTVSEQFRLGRAVRRDRIQAGDLVFFDTGGLPASHVGIAIDGDAFVHAPSARGVVRVERLSSPYWSRRWVGGRRLY